MKTASFFASFSKKTGHFSRISAFFLLAGLAPSLPAHAEDVLAGWTNDRIYSISDNLGWISGHRMNGACGLALIHYNENKEADVKSMPLEFLSDKNGLFIRSAKTVKNLKPEDEVKLRLRLGQAKYLLPMTAEDDANIISAELEDEQLKLLLELFYKSQNISLEFPNDTKTYSYPLYGIRPLLRSFKDCTYVNGFADIE